MKRLLNLILMTVVLSIPSVASGVSKGDQYPAVKTPHRDQGTLSKASVQGQVTVINFWATWCAACKVELKEMAHEFKELDKNARIKLAFVSLDKDTKMAAAYMDKAFGKESMLGKNLYFDQHFTLAESFELDSFPTTLVVDQTGKVIHIQKGFKEGQNTTKEIAKIALEAASHIKLASE
jgi:peroxiredoxin